jgi:Bacterial Ig domain
MSLAQVARMAATMVVGLCVAACGRAAQVPDNELPSGVVDLPAAGAILRPGPTLVGGWAVDDSGIREIRVYFDGHLKATTGIAVRRPDVAKAMPRYARPDALHGWNVLVDFGMAPGAHTIRVQAVDNKGATRDIGVVPVTVPD